LTGRLSAWGQEGSIPEQISKRDNEGQEKKFSKVIFLVNEG
jgi:hypothetical protein